jgi:hypothetical protein
MFKRSIIDHKTDMTIAIGSWHGPADTDRVVAEVKDAASKIHTLDADFFTSMVRTMLLMGYTNRAQRIVDALTDTEPTRLGLVLVHLLGVVIITVPIAALVALILWAVR